MNTNIEDATIVAEPLTAEESAINANLVAICPNKEYNYERATQIADAIYKASLESKTEALAMVTCLLEALTQAKESIKNQLVIEAKEWPSTKLKAYGVTFQVKEVGTKYYYDEDEEWKGIKGQLEDATKQFKADTKELEARRKAREKYLQETGGVSKYSETTITTSLE